jgi:hypothetical protein
LFAAKPQAAFLCAPILLALRKKKKQGQPPEGD